MEDKKQIALIKAPLRLAWRAFKKLTKTHKTKRLHHADWVFHLSALNSGRPFRCAFDVGANKGQTTDEFVRLMPEAKIFSIEPIPEAAGEITERFAQEPRVKVACVAMDEVKRERTFRINTFNQTSSFLNTSNQAPELAYMELERLVLVQTTTLDAFCVTHGIAEIDILKMDVQGFEGNVLRGATESLPRVRAIYAEVLFGRYYEGQTEYSELDIFLRKRGFWLFRIYHLSHGGDGRLLWADALWLNGSHYPEKERRLDKWEHDLNRSLPHKATDRTL